MALYTCLTQSFTFARSCLSERDAQHSLCRWTLPAARLMSRLCQPPTRLADPIQHCREAVSAHIVAMLLGSLRRRVRASLGAKRSHKAQWRAVADPPLHLLLRALVKYRCWSPFVRYLPSRHLSHKSPFPAHRSTP